MQQLRLQQQESNFASEGSNSSLASSNSSSNS
jgi:hypothetical protein